MNELKPCPFCGGDRVRATYNYSWKDKDGERVLWTRINITCAHGGCWAKGPGVSAVDAGVAYVEAVRRWNERGMEVSA